MNVVPMNQQADVEEFTDDPFDVHFSYEQLSREDEVPAKEDAAVIKAHMKSAAESIITVGTALKRQQVRLEEVGYGLFKQWIEHEFGMSGSNALTVNPDHPMGADHASLPVFNISVKGAEIKIEMPVRFLSRTQEIMRELNFRFIDCIDPDSGPGQVMISKKSV
ncbi:hypothetical protein ACFQ3K_11620 [Brucella gallinifaecis]|uniref:Uncharacterized protein n=1 Tax=Brucella gallinifaecis TaxID=215590 RepID=A0A502BSH5_9HYPH|nr:hypothetical protein [Brucella gallinifaecis]TPF77175.1 hypothetical protein FHY56_02150 [Brucella gallinifaecis]